MCYNQFGLAQIASFFLIVEQYGSLAEATAEFFHPNVANCNKSMTDLSYELRIQRKLIFDLFQCNILGIHGLNFVF